MIVKKTPKVMRISYSDLGAPLLAVVGPLMGLVYIIVLPFVGAISLVYLGGYRFTKGVATLWYKMVPRTIDV